jgi:hypothetical protein
MLIGELKANKILFLDFQDLVPGALFMIAFSIFVAQKSKKY